MAQSGNTRRTLHEFQERQIPDFYRKNDLWGSENRHGGSVFDRETVGHGGGVKKLVIARQGERVGNGLAAVRRNGERELEGPFGRVCGGDIKR